MTPAEVRSLLEAQGWQRMPVNFGPANMIGGVRYMAWRCPEEKIDAIQFWPADTKSSWIGARMGSTSNYSGSRSQIMRFFEAKDLGSIMEWWSQCPSNLAYGSLGEVPDNFLEFVRAWPSGVRAVREDQYWPWDATTAKEANQKWADEARKADPDTARAAAQIFDIERREKELVRKERFAEVDKLRIQAAEAKMQGDSWRADNLYVQAAALRAAIQAQIDKEAQGQPWSPGLFVKLPPGALPPPAKPVMTWDTPDMYSVNTKMPSFSFGFEGFRNAEGAGGIMASNLVDPPRRAPQKALPAPMKLPCMESGVRKISFEED